jgi:hypothetical protein
MGRTASEIQMIVISTRSKSHTAGGMRVLSTASIFSDMGFSTLLSSEDSMILEIPQGADNFEDSI